MFLYDNEQILVETGGTTRRARNVAARGHARVLVHTPDAAWVTGAGPATIATPGGGTRRRDRIRAAFPDDYFADLHKDSVRGRPTVPARVLATTMVLQAHEGLSDREECDWSWSTPTSRRLKPTAGESPLSYTGSDEPVSQPVTYEWNHGLGEVVQAVLDSGLRLTRLEEHRELEWQFFGWMVSTARGAMYCPSAVNDCR